VKISPEVFMTKKLHDGAARCISWIIWVIMFRVRITATATNNIVTFI